MAVMPHHLRLTPTQERDLASIRDAAKVRHEQARRAAKARGRHDFPLFPYECSWAFEAEYQRRDADELRRAYGIEQRRPWQDA
jgi:hypothetical protein